MKTYNLIKIVIVLFAIGIIAYIITNNSQTIEVAEIVNNPIERYDYNAYVDSCCSVIRNGDHASSKSQYESLYRELNEVSQMRTNNAQPLITNANELYEQAFDSYFSVFANEANSFFQSASWNVNTQRRISQESGILMRNYGCSPNEKDSLKRYINYVKGYADIVKRLNAADTCTTMDTYQQCSFPNSYLKYPYSNLTSLQQRMNSAVSTARRSWKHDLDRKVTTMVNQLNNVARSTRDNYVTECQKLINQLNDFARVTATPDVEIKGAKDQLMEAQESVLNKWREDNF